MIEATNKTAFVAGSIAGLFAAIFGPFIDSGAAGSNWVLFLGGGLIVGLPAYFLVPTIPPKERVGLWILRPKVLRGFGHWFLGAAVVSALAFWTRYFLER